MSDIITMDVVLLYDLNEGAVYGAPAGNVGERLTVAFEVGARLVASGAAEPAPEPEVKTAAKARFSSEVKEND